MGEKNPFSKFRTEYMQESAWKYFVKDPFKEYIGEKPIIFEGSRGTGKTMFFLCNSWRQKFEEAISKGQEFQGFIESIKHIGFYYKVDTRFVTSLFDKNIEQSVWQGIFNTYFNVIISKEILFFLREVEKNGLLEINVLREICRKISSRLDLPQQDSLNGLQEIFEDIIINIEHFANNTERTKPIGTNCGTIIESILLTIKKIDIFKNKTFHIFIDEFETLNRYQQIELNTLLKHSDSNIVYDIGVITKGMITYKTASNQEIKPKDDFISLKTDRFEYHESNKYNEFLIDVCRKRLKNALDSIGNPYDEEFLNIKSYLVSYGKEFEQDSFLKSPLLGQLKSQLFDAIKNHQNLVNPTESKILLIYNELTNCQPIAMRMHLALLNRKGRNSVGPHSLVEHKVEDSKVYKEWYHNMRNHIIYLLCHELKVQKKYHGFEVYSALSSGVIRSFLELTEFAFDYAYNNNDDPFTFNNPRKFTVEEQTKAVYYVSKYKVAEIDSYDPGGFKLKSFTKALGKIFGSYHVNTKATLGEVEQNHFTTEINDLKGNYPDAYDLLKLALRHKILEDNEANKTKAGFEFFDYHLNHIYCPTFGISHRRQRKIDISAADLSKLLNGTDKELETTITKLSNTRSLEQGTLFSSEE